MTHALLAVTLLLGATTLAGCAAPPAGPSIREVPMHLGYTADRSAQYATPKEVRVQAGERVRLVLTNDDAPGARDSFHDIALRYANHGTIEHEVPAGATVRTCLPQAEPDRTCEPGKDFFVASERGRFKMWCEVGPLGRANSDGTPQTRHEQLGMWATLVVE